MSEISVLSPVGINRVEAQPITPRLLSLEGVKLGILNNGKQSSLPLRTIAIRRRPGRQAADYYALTG